VRHPGGEPAQPRFLSSLVRRVLHRGDVDVDSNEESHMSVAKVTEISSTSKTSFEDAIQQGLARASKTIRNIRRLWIKEQHVRVTDGKISEYQVNMLVTFELDV
jgi:flavin-binding protein dodecin